MHILITGSAGFIGSYLVQAMASEGHSIYGIDCVNTYYDINLKKSRLENAGIQYGKYGQEIASDLYDYTFNPIDLCDQKALKQIFATHHFDCTVNLAAQAGVRYSLIHPEAYIHSNIEGFLNLLEQCRHHDCKRLVYASSSSVYGNSNEVPFRESDAVDCPVSIYAATKKSNELMAYTYAHLYKIQTTGLRFFTVYGPYGRPDMAPQLFAEAILHDRPIQIFNNGNLARDFTYIDDIIEGIKRIILHPENIREDTPGIPASVYNIGHGSPVQLMDFIHLLEKNIGKEAIKNYVGMQPGDVYQTWADTRKLERDFHYTPSTSLEKGIQEFATWFQQFYQ